MGSNADSVPRDEWRLIIKGWKARPTNTFVSCHSVISGPDDRCIEQERARIGADVDIWQPHITEVILEHRQVTPWQVVEQNDGSSAGVD